MTTENELDVVQTIDTSDKQVEINQEESVAPQMENEQPPEEKPKRGGRKKRDGNELKTENSINDHAMDTQPLFEQPVILEGKRSRKPTSRLELSDLATPKKELSIPQGHGKPLGDIVYSKKKKKTTYCCSFRIDACLCLVNYQIDHASTDALSRLRNICFGRRGVGVRALDKKNCMLMHFRVIRIFERICEISMDLNSIERAKNINDI